MYPTKIRQRKILLLALLPLLILSLDFDATAQQKTFFNPKTISPFERQSDELRYGHYQWNYFQRAYPHGEIPYQRRLLALKQLERMRRAIEVPQPSWTSIGPGNIGGRVNSIAIDPVDENIIYLGAAEGGVWKSTDAGESWNPLADDLPSLSMGAIGIDPQNPQIIYIGTGEHNFIHQYGCKPSRSDQYPGAGVFKSADGGANWTQAGEKFSDAIVKIVIDPIATEIIYVASIDGIFKSVDGGVSWMDILSGVATDVVIEESSPSILYAAICKPGGDVNNGIYQSTDAGESWAELTQGLPSGEDISRISLAISLSVPLVLYAGIAYSGIGNIGQGKGDVYKTINGGLNWTITSPEPNPDCYKNTIAIDPTNPDIVYSGALLIYKSTDGGASWVNIDPELSTYVDYHTIAINRANPQTFYTGNDRGVYKSIDGGGSWINLNQGLAITQFYDIAVDPSTASIIYGGCQDNGVLKYLGTLDWIDVDYFNDGGYNAVDYTNPNIIYFENQFARIKKSLDGGTTSFLILNGLDKSRTGFVTPFIIDPKVHDKLYLGTYKLHRTTDGGDLWKVISPDLTKNLGEYDSFISAIGVSKSNPDVIYVGTSDGNLQVTTDGGSDWQLRTNGLPNRFITDIAVDEDSFEVAYLTFSGYDALHIFKTADLGQSWQSIDSNLPDIPVNTILLRNGKLSALYIGTDIGVFKSTIGSGSWLPYNEELPVVVVSDLEINEDAGLIRAATMGRSVFEIEEQAEFLIGDVNGDGAVNILDVVRAFNIILYIPPPPTSEELLRADVNSDGIVDITDVLGIVIMVIIDIILGGEQ